MEPQRGVVESERESTQARGGESRTQMSGGRIVLVIVGSVVALLGVLGIAAGGGLLVINESERDEDGFFTTASKPFATESHAIVSENLDIGTDGPDWLFEEGRLATIRVRGSDAGGGELFIGIAPTGQVREYLAGTRYALLRDLELDPFRATYRPSPGGGAPTDPAAQTFWSESAQGPGTQTVEWEVAKGNWSVVVMNADAGAGVDARLSLGAKVGFVFWAGLGILIAGLILLAGGAAMLYFGLRRRPPSTAVTPAAAQP